MGKTLCVWVCNVLAVHHIAEHKILVVWCIVNIVGRGVVFYVCVCVMLGCRVVNGKHLYLTPAINNDL